MSGQARGEKEKIHFAVCTLALIILALHRATNLLLVEQMNESVCFPMMFPCKSNHYVKQFIGQHEFD